MLGQIYVCTGNLKREREREASILKKFLLNNASEALGVTK